MLKGDFMKKLFFVSLLFCGLLAGCATQPLDAPCNPHAFLCGQKMRINP